MYTLLSTDSRPTLSSPADCALLIAIPLGREAFFSDLHNPEKDFARQFARERASQTEESIWRAYQGCVELVNDVCDTVRAQGVRVLHGATLEDLLQTIELCGVVTLVAHWRSALFRAADIVVPARVAAFFGDDAQGCDAEELCSRLNTVLKLPDERFDNVLPESYGESAAVQRKWHVRRLEVEQQLGNAVRGGAAVELADGFHRPDEITAKFSREWGGLLDLTVCQSVLFAEEVRARCRHGLVISAANRTSVDFRLALYAQIIALLSREPQPFEDAVIKIRSSLVERYGNSRKKNNRSTRRS